MRGVAAIPKVQELAAPSIARLMMEGGGLPEPDAVDAAGTIKEVDAAPDLRRLFVEPDQATVEAARKTTRSTKPPTLFANSEHSRG